VLDLLHNFCNLDVNPEDRENTAFSTWDGHYQFARLPMGLKNSPVIFKRLIYLVLSECLGKTAFIYSDNTLVFSSTPEQHLQHLQDIFNWLDWYLHACYLHVIKVLPHNQRQPMLSINRYIYLSALFIIYSALHYTVPRCFFSYIGTIYSLHAFDLYSMYIWFSLIIASWSGCFLDDFS
jgi:hypothetical protein